MPALRRRARAAGGEAPVRWAPKHPAGPFEFREAVSEYSPSGPGFGENRLASGLARPLLQRRGMSHRLPVLFAALAAVVSIGVLVQDACRSRLTALPAGDRAPAALHRPGPAGGHS